MAPSPARIHAQGGAIALSGTRREALEALAAELGARVAVCPADLREAGAADGLIAATEAALGPLSILVNNAGFTRDMLALRMQDADWQSVLDVDLSAPFRLIRAALRGMLKRRAGRIINIASIVGVTGNAGQANYAAAKAGIIGMTKSLAQEVGSRGVTVNVIAPGFVQTAMTDVLNDDQKIEAARAPFRSAAWAGLRISPPPPSILSSEEAAWVTGATLHVNGGMAMHLSPHPGVLNCGTDIP